jgi:hypothetical protein
MVPVSSIDRVDSQPKRSPFVQTVQVRVNDMSLPTLALFDTGALTDLLVSPEVALRAKKQLGARIVKLAQPRQLRDYRGEPAGQVQMKMIATLEISSRRFLEQEFWITDTGHDVLVGLGWMAEHSLLLDCVKRELIWPDNPPVLAKGSPTTSKPLEPDEPLIAAISTQLDTDSRQQRWKELAHTLPTEPISLEASEQVCGVAISATYPAWKTYDGRKIPFPEGEDASHILAVREKLPKPLAHLEGFFSKKEANTLPESRPGHDVVLELEKPLSATGPPSYRTPIQFLPLEKETTDKLLEIGFIERSMQEKAAPVLFVPKSHSTDRRFCVDYRWMNHHLKSRLFPAPSVDGTIFNCRTAKVFSKIDIIQAFHRLRMAIGSEHLTAFKTRFGTFQWKVLPFGLKVGPAWFQAFVNAQLNELLDFCASAYADDILIYSDDEKEHWAQCEEVIYRLHKANLQGDIKKSRFAVREVDYLGLVMEAGVGIRIDPEKVKAIQAWKLTDISNRTALRSFLGLCNYIRMFCYHASEVAEPLNRLLKKDSPWEVGEEQKKAFETLKDLACQAPVLAFFKPGRPTKVETDASRNATGGVIWQQQEDEAWKPVGFFSKTMTPAERAYPIQDRELLAVVQTLEHYYPELVGSKFFVVTDHQALVYFSSKRVLSTRQVRWAEFLSNFDITFQYRPGKENIAADALSRKTADLPTVKAREREDRIMELIPGNKLGFPVAALTGELDVPRGADLVDLIRQESGSQDHGIQSDGRLYVPEKTKDGRIYLRTALIREAHEPPTFAHPGQNKVIRFLQREYTWPEMKKTIRQYIKNCHDCCRNKAPRDRRPGLLHSLPVPDRVWDQVAVDGKVMPRDQLGYDYVWTFIDKFSRIMATLPGKKDDTAEVLASRYYRYLYRLFGVPAVWLTDNAGPFISAFIAMINKLTGTKHRHGSAYHPQTQGAVEVTNQELDQRLRFYVNKYQDDWSQYLPAFDFAHNSSWHAAINMAPLTVALGRDPRNPLSVDLPAVQVENNPARRALELVERTKEVQDQARAEALQTQRRQEAQANKKRRPVDFTVGDRVFLSKKGFHTTAPTTRLDSQFVGPFEILQERGHSYILDLPPTYTMKNLFHADRLRKANDKPLPQQVQPPPPPEEINGEPEYEVERIETSRLFGKSRILQYQVAWRGYDPDDAWYPARNFKNAPWALDDFHKAHPTASGPPIRLQDWLRAAAEDRDEPDHPDDNVAVREDRQHTRSSRRHI